MPLCLHASMPLRVSSRLLPFAYLLTLHSSRFTLHGFFTAYRALRSRAVKPIRFLGFSGLSSIPLIVSTMACMEKSWAFIFRSIRKSLPSNFLSASIRCFSLTNARTTNMPVRIALLLFRMEASIIAPCSVKTAGRYLVPPHLKLEVANCDLKFRNSFRSRTNIKSEGNRSIFLLTRSLSRFVGTPYILAKSKSSITFWPRIMKIRRSI